MMRWALAAIVGACAIWGARVEAQVTPQGCQHVVPQIPFVIKRAGHRCLSRDWVIPATATPFAAISIQSPFVTLDLGGGRLDNTSGAGRLDISMDWVLDVNVISWVLVQAPCTFDQFHADQCNLNLFPPPKPLEGSTYWLNAGKYELILGNFGALPDVASAKVVLAARVAPRNRNSGGATEVLASIS
jgi:hypothetical protein